MELKTRIIQKFDILKLLKCHSKSVYFNHIKHTLSASEWLTAAIQPFILITWKSDNLNWSNAALNSKLGLFTNFLFWQTRITLTPPTSRFILIKSQTYHHNIHLSGKSSKWVTDCNISVHTMYIIDWTFEAYCLTFVSQFPLPV